MTEGRVCTGDQCGGYDRGQYEHERRVKGVTVGSMSKRGALGVTEGSIYRLAWGNNG